MMKTCSFLFWRARSVVEKQRLRQGLRKPPKPRAPLDPASPFRLLKCQAKTENDQEVAVANRCS